MSDNQTAGLMFLGTAWQCWCVGTC